jgi:acyl-CoA thioesterase-1
VWPAAVNTPVSAPVVNAERRRPEPATITEELNIMNRARVATLFALVLLAVAGRELVALAGPVDVVSRTTRAPQGLQGSPTPAAARPRVVFLGDSLTAGYGLARDESVPALIAARLVRERLPYEVVNAGVSGDTSAGGLSRLNWSIQGDVAVLVIELGANDGLRGLPVSALKSNLNTIITRAKARGITVLLTGMEAPPNFGAAYTSEFRAVFHDLARTHKVAFLPFYLQGVAGNPALNIADGIHPNAAGARIVADAIWAVLQPLLTRR